MEILNIKQIISKMEKVRLIERDTVKISLNHCIILCTISSLIAGENTVISQFIVLIIIV